MSKYLQNQFRDNTLSVISIAKKFLFHVVLIMLKMPYETLSIVTHYCSSHKVQFLAILRLLKSRLLPLLSTVTNKITKNLINETVLPFGVSNGLERSFSGVKTKEIESRFCRVFGFISLLWSLSSRASPSLPRLHPPTSFLPFHSHQ